MSENSKQVDKGPLKSEHISQYGERDYEGRDIKRHSKDLTESGVQDLARKLSKEKVESFKTKN